MLEYNINYIKLIMHPKIGSLIHIRLILSFVVLWYARKYYTISEIKNIFKAPSTSLELRI